MNKNKKNKKNLNKKQLVDIAFASTVAAGIIIGQTIPIVNALENKSTSEQKNVISGYYYNGKNDENEQTNGSKYYSLIASLDEGYNIQCIETGTNLQFDDINNDYFWSADKNGTYHFVVKDNNNNTIGDSFSIIVTGIDENAIVIDANFSLMSSNENASLYANLENYKNKNFEVTLDYSEKADGSNSQRLSFPLISGPSISDDMTSNYYETKVSKNGYYFINVKNEKNETKKETIHVTGIDESQASFTMTDITEITKYKEYSVNFHFQKLSQNIQNVAVQLINVETNQTVNGNSFNSNEFDGSLSVNKNGKYKLVATYGTLGQTVETSIFDITQIDTDKPEVTLDYKDDGSVGYVSVKVNVKDANTYTIDIHGVGEKIVVDKNNTFIAESNGDYIITVRDIAGNETVVPLKIENISDIPSDATVSTSFDNTLTDKNVSVELQYDSGKVNAVGITNDKGVSIPVNNNVVNIIENGTYYINFTYIPTNTQYRTSFVINNIDKEAPIVSYELLDQGSDKTIQKVKISVIEENLNSIKMVDSKNREYTPDVDNIFTFTENDYYNLIVTDLAGHVTSIPLNIGSIENNLPEKDITMSLRYEAVNEQFDVLVNVENSTDYTIYLNNIKIEGNVFTVKENGTYTVKVVDNKTGKFAEETIEINSFIKETDVIDFIFDGNKTNKDVDIQLDIQNKEKYDSIIATLDGEILPIINDTVTIQKNGKLVVVATNTTENIQITNEITIDFINKEAIDVVIDKGIVGDAYASSANMQFKFKDYNKIYNIYVNDELITGYNYEVLENGEYHIYIVDDYGNEFETDITYNTIVKNHISIKEVNYDTLKTNKDIPLNVEIEGNGFVIATLENINTGQKQTLGNLNDLVTNPSYEFLISENGTYKLSVKTTDAEGVQGNTEERIIQINNIRKNALSANINGLYDDDATTNSENIRFEEVVVNVLNSETFNPNEKYYIYLDGDQIGEQNIGSEYRFKITENALHVIEVRDEYGNSTSQDISVRNVKTNTYSSITRTKIENNDILGYSTIQYNVEGLLHYAEKNGINKKYTVMVYNKQTNNYVALKNISYDTLFTSDETSPKFSEELLSINVRDNANYLIQFYDESNGVLFEEELEIKNINEIPEVEFKYSDTTNDASDVSLEIDANTTQNYSLFVNDIKQTNNKKYTFLKNGIYNVKVLYESGVYKEDTIEINNIDLSKIDLSYIAAKKPTYNFINVSFNLKYNDSYQELTPIVTYIDSDNNETNIEISGFADKHNGVFTADKNGTYRIKAGTFEKDITISNIIEKEPEINIEIPTEITEDDKETSLNITTDISELLPLQIYVANGLNPNDNEWEEIYNNNISETPDSIEDSDLFNYITNKKFKNGTYSFKFVINNELTLIENFTINIFNDIEVIVNYDDTKTNKDVEIKYTVNYDKDYSVSILDDKDNIIKGESNSFNVSENGKYRIIISYDNGKTFIKEVEVSNINKEKPEFSLSYLTNITTQNIELGINVSNKENYKITVNGHDVINNIYTISANGDYEIVVVDDYGNTTSKSITIDNIVDKPLMVKSIIKNTNKTNQDVEVDLDIWSENNLSYDVVLINKDSSVEKSLGQINKFTIQENGKYMIRVTDMDNNIAETSFEITNINKENPILNINYDVDLDKPTNVGINTTFTVQNKDKYKISVANSKGKYLIPSYISSGSAIDEVVGGNGLYEVNGFNASIVYNFSINDTYHVYIIDEYGNTHEEDIIINNVYLEKPDVKLNADLEKTVESLIVGINVSNKSEFTYIVKNIETNIEKSYTQNDTSFTINENGKYQVIVSDIANNKTILDLNVKNIDKEAPVLDVKYDKTLTNKTIESTYTIKDASKTVNSVYYFKNKPFEDTLDFNDVLDFIKDKNSAKIKSTEIEFENTVTGKFSMNDSGYYLIISQEALNHNIYKLINVDNINKELPDFELNCDNLKWTKDNININVNVKNKNEFNVFLQGREIENKFAVYQNGTYVVTVKDKYGNELEKSITITNIDKNAPVLNVSYLTTPTNKDIVMNVTAIDTGVGLKSLTAVGKNGNVYPIGDNKIVISKNDSIVITAIDYLGNTVEKEYIIKNIDKVAPTLEIVFDNKKLTSKNVPVKFNVKDINNYSIYINKKKISGTTYYASKNGEYTVTVLDDAGNRIEKTFKVSNIDKKGPTIKLSYDDKLTEKPIVVKYEAHDENGVSSVTVNGKNVENSQFTIEKNGDYTVRVMDKAGNVFAQTLKITNIDLLPPEIKDVNVYIKDLKTYLDIYAIDDASGVKSIKVNGIDVTKFKNAVRVFNDGLYIIEVTDNLNKVTTEIFEVTGVRLKRIIPCEFKKSSNKEEDTSNKDDSKNNSIINDSNKDDKNPNISETGKEKIEISNNADKIIFGTSKYAINVKESNYKPTNDELLKWYEVVAPKNYAINFNILDIKFDIIGDYKIPITINSPDGDILNHEVTLIINEIGASTGPVVKSEQTNKTEEKGLLNSIGSIFSSDNLQLIGKIFAIGLGVVGLSAGGYYAFSETKKRQEASMVNVLIIINGKPFTVERIKRTMNILDLKKHLVEDILSEYFKNTKERIKVKSIVPVDEEIFNVKEKALASQKGCSKIIYITYEIKKDLR